MRVRVNLIRLEPREPTTVGLVAIAGVSDCVRAFRSDGSATDEIGHVLIAVVMPLWRLVSHDDLTALLITSHVRLPRRE